MALGRWLAASALAAALALPATAGTDPPLGLRENDPGYLAFTGARLVVAPGRVVEEGTLVVRDGRVVAAAGGAEVPEGATEVPVAGRTIYPGFVDPFTEYGLGHVGPLSAEEDDDGDGPKYEGDREGADAWNDAVHAEREWVARFQPDAEAAAKLLERGVTTVHSAKRDGILRGRGFVARLAGETPNEAVLRARGLHAASFDKGSSRQAYPSSLMGSIALLRQTFLDAAWYRRARAASEADPSLSAPEVNRALAALAGEPGPLLFETEEDLSLLRAARIGRETGVPLVHVGSNFEYARLDEVAALGEPIVLPLSFPAKPEVETYEKALDVSLADLRHWERAPGNAAALAERGVRFAFTGHRLRDKENKEDFLANWRRTVERGLAAETALAALTTVPAELLGVDAEVGTLEPGKRADFLVADGDLLVDGSRILAVWIGGERVQEIEPLDAVDFTGAWNMALEGETYRLTLRRKGKDLSGDLSRGEAKVELAGVQEERDRVSFRADLGELGLPGVVRVTLLSVGADLDGRAALPDGRLVAAQVTRAAEDGASEEEMAKDEGAEAAEEEGEDGEAAPDEAPGALVSRLTVPNVAFGLEAPPAPEDVLVRGATVWTVAEAGTLQNADLLVVGGKIAAVGRGLEAPEGVRVLDGTGLHVTPGILDEHSHLAISRGVNEGSHSVTAEVRIGDVVDPDDVGIYRALAGGVTAAQLLHGSANSIGGQAQVIKHRWGMGAEDLKFDAAPPTIKFALGENVKQSNWGDENTTRYPQTRMGVETIIRDAFLAARRHREERQAWEALPDAERARLPEPRRDLQLEALAEILEGERFIHCHSYVQSEILMLMRLAEELGFRVQTFTHILEGYKVAPEMAAHGAGASSFSDWWAYKFEVYDAIPYNTCLLHRAGVVTSVNSDSGEMIRRLNQEAGKSVLYCGMEPEEAIKLVTLNPAIQLRIDDRVGSLEPGKDADFVIWNDQPLSMYARVEETWVDGRPYFTRQRDAALREADRAEREALLQKALASDDEGGAKGRDETKDEKEWQCDDTEDVWCAR